MTFILNWLRWARTHKKIVIPAIIVLLLILFLFRPKPPKPIETTTIHEGTVTQIVSVSGTVAAKKSVNLTFPISGTISWVGVGKGDSVTAGQTIATLDQRTAQKNLQATLLNYSEQRNTFDQTLSNDNVKGPADALNDTVKRLLEDNQYDLDKAVNSVELQDLARQQAILTTPISGVVTRADALTAGVTALATTTFTVTDPSSIAFDMDVDEADISKIQEGQIAQITLDAYSDTVLSLPITSIDFVSHTTTSGGSAYTVEADLPDNSALKYRVGMNGNADIITDKRVGVLSVPLSAITDDQYVYVLHAKRYVKTKIVLGLQSDTDAQVLAGLKNGDVVALDPTAVVNEKLVASR